MEEAKMIELAEQLLLRAQAGGLEWAEGTRDNDYMVEFPDISLAIRARERGYYVLELINNVGDEIESLDSHVVPGTETILREIYGIARRKTLDIDGNINKALEYLKQG